MSKLTNYNSFEGKVLKEIFQDNLIDPYIALIVESYIYEEVIIKYYRECWIMADIYFEEDMIKEKYMTKYGEKEGKYTQYCRNGNKFIENFYIKGKKDGLYQQWNENGQKCEECYYKDGKKEGLFQSWWSNGKKRFECTSS